jgi:hypothetical protein
MKIAISPSTLSLFVFLLVLGIHFLGASIGTLWLGVVALVAAVCQLVST